MKLREIDRPELTHRRKLINGELKVITTTLKDLTQLMVTLMEQDSVT